MYIQKIKLTLILYSSRPKRGAPGNQLGPFQTTANLFVRVGIFILFLINSIV